MMTFGSFMKWDTWKCLVARKPSRKNVFSLGTEGKHKCRLQTTLRFSDILITAGEASGEMKK